MNDDLAFSEVDQFMATDAEFDDLLLDQNLWESGPANDFVKHFPGATAPEVCNGNPPAPLPATPLVDTLELCPIMETLPKVKVELPVQVVPVATSTPRNQSSSSSAASSRVTPQPVSQTRRGRKKKRAALGNSLPTPPPDVAADPSKLAEFIKVEERRRRNRMAADKSRRKRKMVEQQEAVELQTLRKVTKQQEQEIAGLRAENNALKTQVEFFQKLFMDSTAVAGSAAAAAAVAAAAARGAVDVKPPMSYAGGSSPGMSSSESVSSAASYLETPATPTSDCEMSDEVGASEQDALRHRKRRRCNSVDSSSTTASDVSGSSGNSSSSGTSGMRTLAVSGALLALVFGMVISMNVAPEELMHVDMSKPVDGGLAAMFGNSAVSQSPQHGAAPVGQLSKGRVLHKYTGGVASLHTQQVVENRMTFGHASAHVGSTDAAALAAAFELGETPTVPHVWTPSAAVTFMLSMMGMRRFAEVVLVNSLLLGLACGMWAGVQKCRKKRPALESAEPADRPRKRQRTEETQDDTN